MKTETNEKVKYNEIPKQVSRKDFNRYINPHLRKRNKGPKPKLSHYKIFNYILYVLHTGIQWRQLRTRRNEIHWSNVYKWHNRWSKDGLYERLFNRNSASMKECNHKASLHQVLGAVYQVVNSAMMVIYGR